MNSDDTRRKQVPVCNPMIGENVTVDEGLVDVLKLIWEFGWSTHSSCQERHDMPGIAYLDFGHVSFAEEFMNIVLRHTPREVNWEHQTTYQRITRHCCKPCWEIKIGIDTDEPSRDVSFIYFSAMLFFPAEDLTEIVRCLQHEIDSEEIKTTKEQAVKKTWN